MSHSGYNTGFPASLKPVLHSVHYPPGSHAVPVVHLDRLVGEELLIKLVYTESFCPVAERGSSDNIKPGHSVWEQAVRSPSRQCGPVVQ